MRILKAKGVVLKVLVDFWVFLDFLTYWPNEVIGIIAKWQVMIWFTRISILILGGSNFR